MRIPSRNKAGLAASEQLVPIRACFRYSSGLLSWLHLVVLPVDKIFQDLVEGMTDVQITICIRWSIVEGEDSLDDESNN